MIMIIVMFPVFERVDQVVDITDYDRFIFGLVALHAACLLPEYQVRYKNVLIYFIETVITFGADGHAE